MNSLAVTEIRPEDVPHIIAYWQSASPAFLRGMGADPALLPDFAEWARLLHTQIALGYRQKSSYCIIWLYNGNAVGHTNVNQIAFGEEAYMHLHLWDASLRGSGIGTAMLRLAIPHFFDRLFLQDLYCEPYALNPGPNNTLAKLGFDFVKEYTTIPGSINFEQPVKQWRLSKQRFEALRNSWTV